MKARYVCVLLAYAAISLLSACERQAPPRVAPTTGSATSADGVAIKYESVGNGGVALVFVHCWTCNRGFWDAQVAHFADRYRVVRLDLAGHGECGQAVAPQTPAPPIAAAAVASERQGHVSPGAPQNSSTRQLTPAHDLSAASSMLRVMRCTMRSGFVLACRLSS